MPPVSPILVADPGSASDGLETTDKPSPYLLTRVAGYARSDPDPCFDKGALKSNNINSSRLALHSTFFFPSTFLLPLPAGMAPPQVPGINIPLL